MIDKLLKIVKIIVIILFGSIFRLIEVLQPKFIVIYYVWPDFERKAKGIADVLLQRGVRVHVRSGHSLLNRVQVKVSNNLHIGFWNNFDLKYLPKRYIFFNSEPLSVPKWRDNLDWFKAMTNACEVWGYNRNHEKYVTPLGVPFYYVPFSYSPYYERSFQNNTENKKLNMDIDVFFAGDLSERRKFIVDKMRGVGISVYTVDYRKPVYGKALDELLVQSKVILSVFNFDDPETHNADFARLDHLLSNRCFVIHEKLSNIYKDNAFEEHVVTCSYEEIPALCLYFIEHPEERKYRAERAHEWFKKERTFETVIPFDNICKY